MKLLMFCFLFFGSIVVQAQAKHASKNVLIGFNFSPDYSYRKLSNAKSNSFLNELVQLRNDMEKPNLGYTTGLNASFNLSQQFGLETGIQFSKKGYKTNEQDLFFEMPTTNPANKATNIYTYQYIGIPLKARFLYGNKNVKLLTSVGVMTNFLVGAQQVTRLQYTDGKEEKLTQSSTSGLKKVDISPMVSVGVDYKVNRRIHFIAEPTFRYAVTKLTRYDVKEQLWSAGVNVAVYYALQ